jgi:hypothetical protein
MIETIEWHSVNEQKPPEHEELFLQIRMENGLLEVCVGWLDGHGDWVLHASLEEANVLWWAQMPEGPQNK